MDPPPPQGTSSSSSGAPGAPLPSAVQLGQVVDVRGYGRAEVVELPSGTDRYPDRVRVRYPDGKSYWCRPESLRQIRPVRRRVRRLDGVWRCWHERGMVRLNVCSESAGVRQAQALPAQGYLPCVSNRPCRFQRRAVVSRPAPGILGPQASRRVLVCGTTREYRTAAVQNVGPSDVCLEVGCHQGGWDHLSRALDGSCSRGIPGPDAGAVGMVFACGGGSCQAW